MDDVKGRENEEEVMQGNNDKRQPESDGKTRGILQSTHDTLPGAAIAGALVGSTWASAALLCTCLVAVCSGNDFVTARWAMSLVIAFVACGVLQRVSFDCRKTDGWSPGRQCECLAAVHGNLCDGPRSARVRVQGRRRLVRWRRGSRGMTAQLSEHRRDADAKAALGHRRDNVEHG